MNVQFLPFLSIGKFVKTKTLILNSFSEIMSSANWTLISYLSVARTFNPVTVLVPENV